MGFTVHLVGLEAGVQKDRAAKELEAAIGVDAETARTLVEATPLALERGVEEKRARDVEGSLRAAGFRVRVEEEEEEAADARPAIGRSSGVKAADTELELRLDDVEAMLAGKKVDPAPRVIMGKPSMPPPPRASLVPAPAARASLAPPPAAPSMRDDAPIALALFCPSCGVAQDAGGQSCTHCGARLNLGRTIPKRTSIAPDVEPPQAPAGPSARQILLWGVLLLAMIAGAGILIRAFAPP